jgi:hypothetical protein
MEVFEGPSFEEAYEESGELEEGGGLRGTREHGEYAEYEEIDIFIRCMSGCARLRAILGVGCESWIFGGAEASRGE